MKKTEENKKVEQPKIKVDRIVKGIIATVLILVFVLSLAIPIISFFI